MKILIGFVSSIVFVLVGFVAIFIFNKVGCTLQDVTIGFTIGYSYSVGWTFGYLFYDKHLKKQL